MASLSELEAPRALITGVCGFTGRYLAKELQSVGYQIFGITQGREVPEEGVFDADLCDHDDIRHLVNEIRPTAVIHLAAVSFVPYSEADAIYRVNIVGTRNLLEALAGLPSPPRSVLLASSANIYGNADVPVIDETVTPAPANDYAVSKLAMEHMARLWMDRLPITITRPFNYTGVGQGTSFLLPKIVDHFRRRAPEIELGNLDVARDFSDVRTVTAAYRRLIEVAPAGETFNVCSGTAHTLSDVLRMMADIAGYKIAVKVNPAFVRANEVKQLLGTCAKLTQRIGPLPTIPLAETLRWMYSYSG